MAFRVEIELFLLCGVFILTEGIAGGHDTKINRHPWLLSLQHDGVHFCGATLVKEEWALTSAKCASKYFDLTVRAGSNYTTKDGEVYEVKKIFIHPDYDEQTLDSDIALLQLSENVTANHTVPMSFPRSTQVIGERSLAGITGWGKTAADAKNPPAHVQFAQVPTRTLTDCRRSYPDKTVTENMLCYGYTNRNITSCEGDFGGPVVIFARVFGIQSWGGKCGDAAHPSVFVKVAEFLPWLNETMGGIIR